MKTEPPTEDAKLHALLRTWEIAPQDDPALARKVWARLEAEGARGAIGWFDRLVRLLARPVGAVATIALFGALGAVAADVQLDHRHNAEISRLAAEYARTIDPILMTHAADDVGHQP